MKSLKGTLWIAVAIASQSAWAQAPNAPASSAAADPSATGPAFIQEAAEINLTELQLSKLAMNDSTTPVIIKFSSGMTRDLTDAHRSLRALAERNHLSIPSSLDAEHAAMVKSLGRESGSEFDTDYAKDIAKLHARAAALYQAEMADTNPDLSSYARSSLPTIEKLEGLAQSLSTPAAPGVG